METVGSLIDKLSINELKIYHMNEQKNRQNVTKEFQDECSEKINILELQKKDLKNELETLIDDVSKGNKTFKVYRQMKMYNEKKYKD